MHGGDVLFDGALNLQIVAAADERLFGAFDGGFDDGHDGSFD